jgi:uncharacterized protein (TIGR03083 family)
VDVASLIDQLALDGPLLASAAADAGLDTPVPATEWNVRQLVTHVGGVHRWAADIVATANPNPDTPTARAVGTRRDDAELLAWFRDGHAALVETLRAAPDVLECFTFLPAGSALQFWARRQAHETAIHRADAESATGDVTPFDAGFAQDGIAELLHGFARRSAPASGTSAKLGVAASDGASWLVTLGVDRIDATEADDLADADATIRGDSSDLYLWLWNRRSAAMVDGDERVAKVWASSVRVRWG